MILINWDLLLPIGQQNLIRYNNPLINLSLTMNSGHFASTADQIDALLPQTQCGLCGYKACRPYAEAIAQGVADINQCSPGGQAAIVSLARLLGREPIPLNPAFDGEQPRQVAVIDETECIGCTRCIPACPVDAIIGASKQMHSVIPGECTGCKLCVVECPVDCIAMLPRAGSDYEPNQARKRYQAKLMRLADLEAKKLERMQKQKQLLAKIKQDKTSQSDLK